MGDLLGERVDRADRLLERLHVRPGDEVRLVEQDLIREGHLLHGLVDGALGPHLVDVVLVGVRDGLRGRDTVRGGVWGGVGP